MFVPTSEWPNGYQMLPGFIAATVHLRAQVDADLKELDEPARPLSYERVSSSCESLHLAWAAPGDFPKRQTCAK